MTSVRRLLFLFLLISTTLSAQPTELRVLSASPQGATASTDQSCRIIAIFSEPMTALTVASESRGPFPLDIRPSVKGTYRWLGTTTLAFIPTDTLPRATRFTATIPAGTRALSGAELPQPYTWTFETLRPDVARFKTFPQRNPMGLRDSILIVFNQPIDPATIGKWISLNEQSGHNDFYPAFTLRRPTDDELLGGSTKYYSIDGSRMLSREEERTLARERGRAIMVAPMQPYRKGSMILFICKAGLQAKEGALGMEHTWRAAFEVYDELKFIAVQASEKFESARGVRFIFSNPVSRRDLLRHLTIKPAEATAETSGYDDTAAIQEIYFKLKPDTDYEGAITAGLNDVFGTALASDVPFSFRTASYEPSLSMTTGPRVIEAYEDHTIRVQVRNCDSIALAMARLRSDQLVPFLTGTKFLDNNNFTDDPFGRIAEDDQVQRIWRLSDPRNTSVAHAIDLDEILGAKQPGIAVVQVRDGRRAGSQRRLRSIVQVTDIGLTSKFSADSILIWATRLKDASALERAEVEVRTDANDVVWSGTTDARGMAAIPGWGSLKMELQPGFSGINQENGWVHPPRLWVIVKVGDDCAYTSLQGGGVERWGASYNIMSDWSPQPEKYEGVLFTDRGLYKSGERVNIKAVVRMRKEGAWHVVAEERARVKVRDPRGDDVLTQEVLLDEFGSFAIAIPIKPAAPTGRYAMTVWVHSSKQLRPLDVWMYAADGSFSVEAFREAEFEVRAGFGRDSYTIGDTVEGRLSAQYLFGAPMKKMPMRWEWSLSSASFTPKGYEAYSFGPTYGLARNSSSPRGPMSVSGKAALDDSGAAAVSVPLPVRNYRGTCSLRLTGGATSASRQEIYNSSYVIIHGGEYYIGLKPGTMCVPPDSALACSFVAVTKDGVPVAHRSVTLKIYRRSWRPVYWAALPADRAWHNEPVDSLADSVVVITANTPRSHRFLPTRPGFYYIDASSIDDRGDTLSTQAGFYASGPGTAAWGAPFGNRVELVADRTSYAPGDRAVILVINPYERANALVSIEREGILSHYTTVLEGAAPRITIPIEHQYLPNVIVSVVLLRGRTDTSSDTTEAESTRPSFRIGHVNLRVSPEERHLHVGVETSRAAYRPGDTVTAFVTVRNAAGAGVKSQLALSAADIGRLNLIDYHLPDPFGTFYCERLLGVSTADTRLYMRDMVGDIMRSATNSMRIADEMGFREDFAPSAYWDPALLTDDSGRATVRFKLPDNITAFKLMAAAQTLQSEFGFGDATFRASKPLLIQPSLPALARVGDVFDAGAVVVNNATKAMSVTITAGASGIVLKGNDRTRIDLAPGEAREATFHFEAETTGKAVVTFSADGGKEQDGLRWSFPVALPRVKESTALFHSSVEPGCEEQLLIPESVDPREGDIEVTAASTALVGLSGGMSYLFTYPYGCLEQRASSVLPIILAEDLVHAFKFEVFRRGNYRDIAQTTIDELALFQNYNGGFSYWKGEESSVPYISAYAVYTLLEANEHGYDVNKRVLDGGLDYLAGRLDEKTDAWGRTMESAQCTRAFMLYTLARAGRPDHRAIVDAMFSTRASLPLFAKAYLMRASSLRDPHSPIADELARDLMNDVKVDPTGASFEEPSEAGLASIFHSNTRTTALILQALVETNRDPALMERIVRRLLSVQRNGHWRTTQENLFVISALAAYYKKYEAEEPDFSAQIALNGKTLLEELFDGRSLETKMEREPLAALLKGKVLPVSITKQGRGRLYYGIRMNYVPLGDSTAKNEGIKVTRSMEAFEDGAQDDIRTGMLVKVTVTVEATQDRHYVAVDCPVPSGFEVVSTSFATAAPQRKESGAFFRKVFDHIERYDDRVTLFADDVPAGTHSYTYLVRAIHAGTFVVPPTHAECMYEPEVFGSTASGTVTIHK